MKCLLAIPLLLMLGGCEIGRGARSAPFAPVHLDDHVSVCEINMRKSDYLGQVVKLQAEYKTDNMTYSYFFDKSCATENVISPGYFRPSETPGLEQFLAEGKRRCKGRGICSLTAHVELVAQVLEEEDGDIYLDIKNVERFSYE